MRGIPGSAADAFQRARLADVPMKYAKLLLDPEYPPGRRRYRRKKTRRPALAKRRTAGIRHALSVVIVVPVAASMLWPMADLSNLFRRTRMESAPMPIEWNPKDREKFRLYMLRFVHAAGLTDLLCHYVRKWAGDLRNSDSPEVQEQFARFEREADRCSAVEALHGKGSLLNLENPFIQRSVGNPRIVTPEQLEAARSYRRVMGIAA